MRLTPGEWALLATSGFVSLTLIARFFARDFEAVWLHCAVVVLLWIWFAYSVSV